MSSHKTDDIEVTIKLSYSLAVLFTVLLDSLVGAMFKLLQDSIGCQTRVSIARGGSKKLVIAITTNHRPSSKYTPKKRPDGS